MFLSSFYCYLNHHPINDFVIDLDNVWKWMGFNQKYNAKYLLEKNNGILFKDQLDDANKDAERTKLTLENYKNKLNT